MALSASWALFILVICACTVILQRNILIDPGLENVMKDIVSDFSYDDGNSEITYKECKDVSMMWKWIETTCEGLYDDESPPGESWSTMDIKNNSNLIPVPMSFKALQSINVISAVYVGRAQIIPEHAKTLRGGINSHKWSKDSVAEKTHTQYRLFLLENNEPAQDPNYQGQIETALTEPHSQFFFLNSLPKNKTMEVLRQLKEKDWINEETTDTVFFKINIINANLGRLAQALIVWDRDATGVWDSFVVTSTAPDDGFYPSLAAFDVTDFTRVGFEVIFAITILFLFIFKVVDMISYFPLSFFDLFDLEIFCIIAMIHHGYVWFQINDASDKYRARLGAPYKAMTLSPDQQFMTKSIMKSLYQGCEMGLGCPGTVFGILNGTSPFRLTFIRSGIIMMFLYCILIFARIPRKSRFALLPNILRKTAPELLRISTLLFLLFSVYASIGTLLFGHASEGFLTLGSSFRTCIEMALGNDIELDEMSKEFVDNAIVRDNKSYIPIMLLPILYRWSFMILMTFILINIFVAIVTNAYDVVREDIEEEENENDWLVQSYEKAKVFAHLLWKLSKPAVKKKEIVEEKKHVKGRKRVIKKTD